MKDLKGKKAKGFKFSGYPNHTASMDKYDGVIGKISWVDNFGKLVCIEFPDGKSWNYPYNETLLHIIEEEPEEEQTIEQILNNIKKLTSEL